MRGALARRAALAQRLGAPLLATNDALMHAPERRALADVVACIREKTTLEAAGRLTQANSERHLKGAARNGAAVRRGAGGGRGDDPLPRRPRLQSRRAGALLPGRAARRFPQLPGRARSLRPRRREAALSRRRARTDARGAEARARADRLARLRALLPHRARHRAFRPLARDSLPGPRLGGQFRGLLLSRDHRGRSRALRPAVRALRLARAQRAAGHRRRLRARAARGGDPVHLPALRARAGRARRRGDHLPHALGDPRDGESLRPLRRRDHGAERDGLGPRLDADRRGGRARRRARSRRSGARAGAEDGGRTDRLSAPSHPAQRRLRHHPRPARRGRAGR